MNINYFENSNIAEAKKLTKFVWGDFFEEETAEVQELIYDFTFEYYDINREYSFCVVDNKLEAFLSAYQKSNKNDVIPRFSQKIKNLNKSDKKTALEIYNLVELCTKEINMLMTEDDIILGLLVSRKKGYGKELLNRLKQTCLRNNLKNLYLWSDSTCDYDYYLNNNFDLVKNFEYIIKNKKINVFVFKKEINNL